MIPTSCRLRRAPLVGGVIVASVLLAGCSGGATAVPAASATASGSTIVAAASQAAVPTVTITPADGTGNVALTTPVTVSIDVGALDDVVVHSDANSTPLAGTFDAPRHAWTASSPLDPGSHYQIQASAHSPAGTTTTQARFTTVPVQDKLTTDVFPGDGATVGVGMPLILKFSAPVDTDRQAALVSRIQIRTSTPVTGAWHWFGKQEVHWRPEKYWTSGTQVQVDAQIRGLQVNATTFALGSWTSSFTIGAKHVSIIDAAAHQMQVFENDKLIHGYPVSAGKPASPTISGTLFVWYKLQKVRMVSTSIGIPTHAPGGYDETVFWDTAISTDGFYVHSAPWDIPQQGNTNVSHGCVNLSPANATEFFNFSQVGDIVTVINTTRVADYSDGEADWQIPFAQFANSGGTAQAAPAPAVPAQAGGL